MTNYGSGPYGSGPFGGTLPTVSLSGQGTFGCRLSLSSTDPYPKADISGSTVYLLPTKLGPYVAYVSSAGVITWAAPETPLSLSLSGLSANSIHDLYLVDQSGVPAIARVPGAAKDAIKFGFRLNANTIAGYLSDGSSVTIGRYRGLYIGSVLISPTAGVAQCDVSYGLSRQWGVWNYFNQAQITLRAGETTRISYGHILTNADWAPYAANTAASLTAFCGRPETVDLSYLQGTWRKSVGGYSTIGNSGIGWNSVCAPSGTIGGWDTEWTASSSYDVALGNQSEARLRVPSAVGANVATMLIKMISPTGSGVTSASPSIMYFGMTEADHVLRASYQG